MFILLLITFINLQKKILERLDFPIQIKINKLATFQEIFGFVYEALFRSTINYVKVRLF